ncbi:MAG TPA: chlorophyll synthesis pathway protein BchC [Pseudomonadota bacterium]|nr:chlorophyll synthesis pathway protein BchC [Pseudomonadota bacterium]
MDALAVVIHAPEQLEVRRLALTPPGTGQVVVEVEWSGISTGTERLLWSGRMPPFPGLGYPLVPGYESVGRIVQAEPTAAFGIGDRVFVPGASCFGEVRGLFGGAASHLVVPAARVVPLADHLAEQGVLLALAATAQHALVGGDGRPAELIVGHGVLGRLLARLSVSAGGAPVVWENNPARATGALGYKVIDPRDDLRHDYSSIYDVSGDATLLEQLLSRLARGGEIVLAGFYSEPLSLPFPLAFLKEARLRVAAEWQRRDLEAVNAQIAAGRLLLDGLITHCQPFSQAAQAYATAFTDPSCLKMLLDWRTSS